MSTLSAKPAPRTISDKLQPVSLDHNRAEESSQDGKEIEALLENLEP
jgi:hypothetical protein